LSVMGHEWAYECPDCGGSGSTPRRAASSRSASWTRGTGWRSCALADHRGAVKELRALFEEADYQAQREYPTPERLREALLRADAWLTANGGQ
jgi:hypothetical protein